MSVAVRLVDLSTGEEVRDEKGNTSVTLGAVPRKGELVSFARRAFEVIEVRYVHNSTTRVVVANSDRPEVAELSYR